MIDVIIRWKCDLCGAEHVECHGDALSDENHYASHLYMGASIGMRDMPHGWHYIGRQIVCPLHEVILKPIDTAAKFDFAKKIYDGHYGYVPVPLPDEMIPDGLQRKEGTKTCP